MDARERRAAAEILARNARHEIRRTRHPVYGVVVVKHIRSEADSPALRARLENEYMLSAALGSAAPRLVLGLETIDGTPALLFASRDAETLRTHAGPMSLEARIELALRAADALTRLHGLGITHNDLSLDNMLVDAGGEVLLIDLELATLAARESCEALHPLDLPGTLRSQAPERSGRTRRHADLRADLYAFGACLYELFADRPPFEDEEPLALIQSHLARPPDSLLTHCPTAPTALARIVAALLAKRPEDRYQSAAALAEDLARILDALRSRRSSADLIPATDLPPARPALPSEPPGRAAVRAELRDILRGTTEGRSAFVVLSGPPGIGKSLLLDHLENGARLDGFERLTIQPRRDGRRDEQSLLPKSLISIAERADQSAVTPALERLKSEMGRVIAGDESTALRMAPTLQLGGTTERFEDALRDMLRALCTAERPMLLLIEDCERLEQESLAQLARIAALGEIPYFLAIASTNAPDRIGPTLEHTFGAQDVSANVRMLSVPPLDAAATRTFVADALNGEEDDLEALAAHIHAASEGRPSRVLEALDELWRTGHLTYDADRGHWRFRAAEETGTEAPATGLDSDTMQLLTLASVFGSDFRVDDLAQIAELSQVQVLTRLAPATQALVVEPARTIRDTESDHSLDDGPPPLAMTFVDEAVRARYAEGIEPDALARLHARIADRLLSTGSHRLRDAVGHLEVATRMQADAAAPPDQIATLCLAAGRKAMADREPRSAFRVLRSGLAMLGAHPWRNRPEESRALTQAAMEAAMRCGDVQQVERLRLAALKEVTDPTTRMQLALLIIQAKRLSGDPLASEELARHELSAIGAVPGTPKVARDLLRLVADGRKLLARLEREGDALPPASESDRLASVLQTHLLQGSARDERGQMLAVLVPALRLTLRTPGVESLPVVLATLAAAHMSLGMRRAAARYRTAAERRIELDGPASALPLRARLVLEIYLRPWFEPAAQCLEAMTALRDDARAAGDIECASYAAAGYAATALVRGAPREHLLQDLESLDRSLRMFPSAPGLRLLSVYRAHLKGTELEARDTPDPRADGPRAQIATLAAWRAMDRGNTASVLTLLAPIMDTAIVTRGGHFSTQVHLLRGLAALDASGTEGLRTARASLRAIRAQIRRGLREAEAKAGILDGAIRAREGRLDSAVTAFERAISVARDAAFLNDERLAWTCGAAALARGGRTVLAERFKDGARLCDARPRPIEADARDHTEGFLGEERRADARAVLDATRIIATEIHVEGIVTALFDYLFGGSLADRAWLALTRETELVLHATAEASSAAVIRFHDEPVRTGLPRLPAELMLATARTQRRQTRISSDAAGETGPMLCLPLRTGEQMVGVLAVERDFGAPSFDEAAVRILAAMTAQAAIGIENARLYDALARARDQYRLLFENAVEGIFQLDLDGRVSIVNHSLTEALGYRSTEEFLAEVRYLPTDIAAEPDGIAGVLEAAIEHGSVHAIEFEALQRDGSRTWLELSARTLLDESGRPTGLEGSLVDVTERRARDEAEQARELAEEATRAKSYFLASMSHEIRTPMNAILGFSELALETELEPRQQEYLGTIRDSARALLGIINDVLDLSRIEAGRMELVSGHFDPVQLLQQIEQLFVARAQQKGLVLRVAGTEALTEALGHGRGLLGDAGRLRQVLVNLVDNALKFTDEGEIGLDVQVHGTYASGLELAFEVTDTGTGISKDDLERLWHAFEQLDASITRRQGGAGLGLAISRQLVLLMGGALSVESTEGVGTRFAFSLRMPFSAPPAVEPARAPSGARPLAGRDLLLAEDNRINQRLILEFLERAGAHVTVTETGREALDMLRIRRFDAVLMDLHMPDVDGVEACRQLRAARWGHDLPVIAVTADAVGDGPLRAREAGFDDIVFKPIDRATLIAALLRLLPGVVEAEPEPEPEAPRAAASTLLSPTRLVPGIDLALGLRNHDHNEGLYLRMLEAFPKHYAEAGRAVRAHLAENRGVEAARIVHNVHGVAGSFGAEHLRARSAELERAIEQDPLHVDGLLGRWEGALTEVLDSVHRVLTTRERARAL